MHSSEEIREELAALKPVLAEEYHVSELGVFGSYVRGEQTEESDLNVLVKFEKPVSLFELVRLENELTTRLGVDVDLVTRTSLIRTFVTLYRRAVADGLPRPVTLPFCRGRAENNHERPYETTDQSARRPRRRVRMKKPSTPSSAISR